MNWDYILSVTPRFVHATLMTLHLAFWGILLSLVIGVICAVITTYKVKSLTWLVKGYIELSRNTPLLIQVFFLYFGLSKIGLTPFQAFRYVIFPQAFAIATPAIGANCLFLMKETSVISAVAVAELMFVAKEVIGLDYKTNEALFLLVVFYLIILLPMSLFISYLERRTRRAKYGA